MSEVSGGMKSSGGSECVCVSVRSRECTHMYSLADYVFAAVSSTVCTHKLSAVDTDTFSFSCSLCLSVSPPSTHKHLPRPLLHASASKQLWIYGCEVCHLQPVAVSGALPYPLGFAAPACKGGSNLGTKVGT